MPFIYIYSYVSTHKLTEKDVTEQQQETWRQNQQSRRGKIGQNSSLNNNNDNNNDRGYDGRTSTSTATPGEDAVKRELERLLRQARKKK